MLCMYEGPARACCQSCPGAPPADSAAAYVILDCNVYIYIYIYIYQA